MKLRTIAQNQTELVTTEDAVIFFSYDTPVAIRLGNGGLIKTDRYHSKTTSKHINNWLAGNEAETVGQEVIEEFLKWIDR